MHPVKGVQISSREQPAIWFLGGLALVKAAGENTNGAFGLLEQVIPAGFASPYHMHHLEDEAFYILEGQVAFVADGKWSKAGPGGYVYLPRGIPHGFRIEGATPARILLLCVPSGFERFVIEMSVPATDAASPPAGTPDVARLTAVAAKYQIDILGHLPE